MAQENARSKMSPNTPGTQFWGVWVASEYLGAESRLKRIVTGGLQERRDHRRRRFQRIAFTRVAGGLEKVGEGQIGERLPTCEEIAVVAGDMREVVRALVEMEIDRR